MLLDPAERRQGQVGDDQQDEPGTGQQAGVQHRQADAEAPFPVHRAPMW
jgi:hypothetical protein